MLGVEAAIYVCRCLVSMRHADGLELAASPLVTDRDIDRALSGYVLDGVFALAGCNLQRQWRGLILCVFT